MDSNVEKREPTLNFEAATEWQKYQLGKATYEAVRRFLDKPGGKEFLDKKIKAAREAEAAAARAAAAAEAAG